MTIIERLADIITQLETIGTMFQNDLLKKSIFDLKRLGSDLCLQLEEVDDATRRIGRSLHRMTSSETYD